MIVKEWIRPSMYRMNKPEDTGERAIEGGGEQQDPSSSPIWWSVGLESNSGL